MSTRSAACAALALALLAAAWLSPRAIPYNMDEFIHYHALACASAAQAYALPVIRDYCHYYDLTLPLTTTPLPLRAYLYIGSIPAVPFDPFWKLVGDPVAVRLAGAACLVLWTFLAARVVRVSASAIVTASLVFPVWLVTFLVDEGPVGLSALLLLAALLAARRALRARPGVAANAWAAACGLALFLGLWTKLVFAWWLPTVVVFVVEEARRLGLSLAELLTRRLAALVTAAAVLAAPTGLLLASTDVTGQAYAAALRRGGFSTEAEELEAVAGRLGAYLVDGSLVAPRNLLLPSSVVDVLPLLLALTLLALGARGSERRREIAAWTLLAAVTFALVAASRHSRWPHHFAFPLLPLVLALAQAAQGITGRKRLLVVALAGAFWATLAARWPAAQVPLESSADKDRLLAFVRERGLDHATLQVHASWGTYYIAQLFGDPARNVAYSRKANDDPARLRQLADLALQQRRPLLLVSSRRWRRLHTPEVEAALGRPRHVFSFGSWSAVEYHPPP